MALLPALCAALLALGIDDVTAQDPFGAQQNVEGDLIAPPRSNVVLQSVVLGRRRPMIGPGMMGPHYDDCDDDISLRQLLRRLLGRGPRRFLPGPPLPYKKTELDEQDSETIDNETLERMVSAVKKARKQTKKKSRREESEDLEDEAEIERLVEFEKEREKPRRYSRMRDGRKRREQRRRHHEDEEETGYWRRRKSGGEEEEDEPSRRWGQRRSHRRKEWEEEEERHKRKQWDEEGKHKRKEWEEEERKHKKPYEEEWVSAKKEVGRRNQEARDILYLPPQYPQSRHYLRPRSSEEYIK